MENNEDIKTNDSKNIELEKVMNSMSEMSKMLENRNAQTTFLKNKATIG